MQEQERRDLRELLAKASAGDGTARVAVENLLLAMDSAGRAADVGAALEQIAVFGPPDLHQVVLARLQANDHSNRQQWPMIG